MSGTRIRSRTVEFLRFGPEEGVLAPDAKETS